ncbi:MAG: outer membrane lipoprotein carrier protein LolA [Succinivibrio sp.]|nr:outer membrane lipoprotein carrier protein LolA [Succinivibrio sp.]
MFKKTIAALLLLLGVHFTAAAATFEQVEQNINSIRILRATFNITTTFKKFPMPIGGEGYLFLSREHGIYWIQKNPLPIMITAGREKYIQQIPGRTPVIYTREQNPKFFSSLDAILDSNISGTRAELEKNFTVEFEDLGGKDWKMILKPKQGAEFTDFSYLYVEGDDFLRKVNCLDKHGNSTEVVFTSVKINNEPITETELKNFQ